MAETGTQTACRSSEDIMIEFKKELEVLVKPEPHECVVCVERSRDTYDIYSTNTVGSGATLHSFLCKFTNSSLNDETNCSKYICKSCLDLINVFEQAEIEYMKLKEAFESIISKNPLFDASNLQPIRLTDVKNEFLQIHMSNTSEHDNFDDFGVDSEDEPLSLKKKKRHKSKPDKRKKNKTQTKATGKRKTKTKQPVVNDSWECNECGLQEETGGSVAETAHKVSVHGLVHDDNSSAMSEVKKEEQNDSMQSFNNGFDTTPKVEIDFDEDVDDDNSSNYMPEEDTPKTKKRVGKIFKSAIDKAARKRERIIHKCDQCDAKYSSLVRLEQHKLKHDGSKPPYICEVCGAHYKHKRACDIHIALHKGISDWKCEECNKLFPSKGALARHNNIHTGKLNYQCDLCGKSFIHTSSFKMHKLSHSGLKPHACDVCGLALMTRSHLKRHKRVHSGEKRHECNICGKRFSERYNLAAHAKSHESPSGVVPPPPRRHLFRCTFCPDRFERRYMLERHMSVTHGRALERPPPTPRNTMSKLLKAQARRQPEEPKDERSSDSRSTPVTAQKLIAQLSSSGPALGAASSWSSAYTEFNLRTDFPH